MLRNYPRYDTNEDTVRFGKSDLNETQAQVKENALKTPCLAKRHREAYDDFRLFSFLRFSTEENLAKCHVFSRSLTTPYTTVKMVDNGKCMRFSVYQTIWQLLQT